jgi:hypothetical protein
MLLFPEVDEIMTHAVAFARLMVAHARFEAEFRNLQGVIAGDQDFGEQPCNQWSTHKRPACVATLIKEKLGYIEEARPIAEILTKAIKPTDDRNLLAHGTWWRFQRDAGTLTVRSGVIRPGEPQKAEWTEADINLVPKRFDDLEIELFNLRRELERNWFEANNPRTG